MNVVTRGMRNAFRNSVRTVSIVIILGLSIGLSLAMLIAHQAVGQKIESVKSSVGNTVSVSPAGVRGFEGGGNPLTQDQLSRVKSIAHVTAVDETLNDRLTTSDTSLQSAVEAGQLGQRFIQRSNAATDQTPEGGFVINGAPGGDGIRTFTPPVTVIGTTNPTNLNNTQGGGSFTLNSGKVFDATSTDQIALVGASLATKNSLTVGSTFTAYGQTITVVGIFDSGNTFSNNLIVMPLATVQALSNQAGAITSAQVTVDSLTNVAGVTTAVKNQLGDAADVTNSADQANQIVAPLQNVQTISLYSLIGAVIAGSVIILLTMIMIVRERRREIGVLKAIGASNLKVVGQFISEALTFTVIGAIIGIGLGTVAGNPITKLLVNNSTTTSGAPTTAIVTQGPGGRGGGFSRMTVRGFGRNLQNIHAAVGWSILLYGLLAAVIIAIVGSAISAFFIAKVRPAEVMRAE